MTLLVGNKGFVFQINRAAQSYSPDLFTREFEANSFFVSSPHLRSRVEWHGHHHNGCRHSFPSQSIKFTTNALQAQLSVPGNRKELKDLFAG